MIKGYSGKDLCDPQYLEGEMQNVRMWKTSSLRGQLYVRRDVKMAMKERKSKRPTEEGHEENVIRGFGRFVLNQKIVI